MYLPLFERLLSYDIHARYILAHTKIYQLTQVLCGIEEGDTIEHENYKRNKYINTNKHVIIIDAIPTGIIYG